MMTVGELNRYIKHYLEEDKTHTAIMLTGEWGLGKSYYAVLSRFRASQVSAIQSRSLI